MPLSRFNRIRSVEQAMKTITRQRLQTHSYEGLSEFYVDCLGMTDFSAGKNLSFGYEPTGCHLLFEKSSCASYVPSTTDFYWKTGITVRNLDIAVRFLKERDIAISEPIQFMDIGYLAHLQDPQGHMIELLQQGFEGNEQEVGEGHPIGGQATVAHITLRVTDIASCDAFLTERLGMRLMSIQPVSSRGFTLYFYCWSDDKLPNRNLQAAENREWLWARPYTLLELQHFHEPVTLNFRTEQDPGFQGFSYFESSATKPVNLSLSDLAALV
jgi:catechol 2,3-dioxygenase-like lactoylglutathione lyase family enzyme/predicted enzyme related to lactoylglutathione lyase